MEKEEGKEKEVEKDEEIFLDPTVSSNFLHLKFCTLVLLDQH